MYMYVPVQIQIKVPLRFRGYLYPMYFEYKYTTVFYELIHVPDCRFNL